MFRERRLNVKFPRTNIYANIFLSNKCYMYLIFLSFILSFLLLIYPKHRNLSSSNISADAFYIPVTSFPFSPPSSVFLIFQEIESSSCSSTLPMKLLYRSQGSSFWVICSDNIKVLHVFFPFCSSVQSFTSRHGDLLCHSLLSDTRHSDIFRLTQLLYAYSALEDRNLPQNPDMLP